MRKLIFIPLLFISLFIEAQNIGIWATHRHGYLTSNVKTTAFIDSLSVDYLKSLYAATKDSDYFQIWSNTTGTITTNQSWITLKKTTFNHNALHNSGGVIAYNLIKNSKYGLTVKGTSNTRIFNNTFYNDATVCSSSTFIQILKYDYDAQPPSTNTTIENNIFYATNGNNVMIAVEDYASLSGLVCDYNVYYNAGDTPQFSYVDSNGNAHGVYFSAWQALGFDTHSIIINPNLNSLTLVPAAALNYGTTTSYNIGLDPSNVWNRSTPLTKNQSTTFQCGAFVK